MRATQETKGISHTSHHNPQRGYYIQATREAQATRGSITTSNTKYMRKTNTTTTINFNEIEINNRE
jgi:hypothetical protein